MTSCKIFRGQPWACQSSKVAPETDDGENHKLFIYDEDKDDVIINQNEEKTENRFDTFLAKIQDVEFSSENDQESDDELLLKTPHGLLLQPDAHRASLLLWDLVIFVLDFLQIYALLQSMALKWIWPKEWMDLTSWTFLFNLDLWDLFKYYTTYKNARDHVTDSSLFPVSYGVWVGFWLVVVAILTLAGFGLNFLNKKRKTKFHYLKRAGIEGVGILAVQVLALPVGVALSRLFQCRPDDDKLDPMNDVTCWSNFHWLFVFFIFPLFAFAFIAFPAWLGYIIYLQVYAHAAEDHETFIRLKETEYSHGVDIIWALSRFYVFSSFRRRGVYFRPLVHVLKFFLVISFSAFFQNTFVQAVFCCVLLFSAAVGVAFVRPHRIPIFNLLLFANFFFLSLDALVGALLSKFGVWNNMSAMFTLEYAYYELLIINLCWLFIVVPIVVYVIARRFHLCGVRRKPMWPRLTEQKLDKLDKETQIYTREVIKARLLLDRAMAMPSIFVPIHDLATEIQIINVYCRESEVLGHPMQKTLWDILDDLVEAHNISREASLFAESVKPSARKTAARFLGLMPALASRLSRRNFDFILVDPVRKKMLFKLYVFGTFLSLYEKVRTKKKPHTKTKNKEVEGLEEEEEKESSPEIKTIFEATQIMKKISKERSDSWETNSITSSKMTPREMTSLNEASPKVTSLNMPSSDEGNLLNLGDPLGESMIR